MVSIAILSVGLYRDIEKENGNYYNGLYRAYISFGDILLCVFVILRDIPSSQPLAKLEHLGSL